ncbi:hypothetical protein ER308_14890 [Egibacter rhizosphaerae]|uniref:DUF1640 domain-containing protein n=1 Tax=Egibacter rhizosphaerae TaxID=1670831 RepID=A0A411YHJ9_9ACTN|nr:hypothetical protein [Egibacter rhizosphaerae]QBI20720.1 hypothetical protein ER308_14890 [Egibacter rhizosphaerae]
MDEASRHRLRTLLAAQLGDEAADHLMQQLPPYQWTDLVTVDVLQRELGALRSELKAGLAHQRDDIAALRNEIASLRSDHGNEIASLRSDHGNEIASLRNEIASLRTVIARQTWIMTTALVAAIAGSFAVATTLG